MEIAIFSMDIQLFNDAQDLFYLFLLICLTLTELHGVVEKYFYVYVKY